MAWIEPFVSWLASHIPTKDDFNRIEGNILYLYVNKVTKVEGKNLSTNDYTTIEKDKLADIELGARKSMPASEILTELKTVDGPGSGLDADTLDGNNSSAFAPSSHASSDTTYGVGTTANYGHVKTINGLTQASHVNGTALSAYQGKVLNDAVGLKALKPVLIRSISMPTTLKGFSVQITDNLDAYDEIILELTGTCTLQNTGTSTAIGKFGFGEYDLDEVDMPVTRISLSKTSSVSATIHAIRRHILILGTIQASAVSRSMTDGNLDSAGESITYTDLYLIWKVTGTGATLNITSGSLTANIYGLKVVAS